MVSGLDPVDREHGLPLDDVANSPRCWSLASAWNSLKAACCWASSPESPGSRRTRSFFWNARAYMDALDSELTSLARDRSLKERTDCDEVLVTRWARRFRRYVRSRSMIPRVLGRDGPRGERMRTGGSRARRKVVQTRPHRVEVPAEPVAKVSS
jgi:hypothetical protein